MCFIELMMEKRLKIDRNLKKMMRHRWEYPIFLLSVVVTIGFYVLMLYSINLVIFSEGIQKIFDDSSKLDSLIALLSFLSLPIILWLIRMRKNGQFLAESIKITENQFPEVYNLCKEYTEIFGLKKMPDVLISSSIKPISYSIPGNLRGTILLNNILIEVKHRDTNYMPALHFALIREFSHLAMGHRSFTRQLITSFTQESPIISNFLTRAEEYTADRWASAMLGYDSKDYYCIFSTGKFLWEHIDILDVAKNAGSGGHFETIQAILSPISPITWRIVATEKMGAFNHRYDGINFDFSNLNLKDSHGNFFIRPKRL